MLSTLPIHRTTQRGISMIEVLITIVILAFGLLGLAGLQGRVDLSLVESYQRAQAVLLLTDMTERIKANRAQAASYVTTDTLGTGDAQPADCSTAAVGVERDRCQWSNALKGAAETKSSVNVGAMIGARGCITQIQAQDSSSGVCAPGIYQISVAWQGLNPTKVPDATCGVNDILPDVQRRAISARVSIGLPECS